MLGAQDGELRAEARGTAWTHRREGHDAGCAGHDAGRAGARDAATRPAGLPRHGHYALLGVPVCAWVCCGASRLCTWCTQPVFGLSTVSESLFGHCS